MEMAARVARAVEELPSRVEALSPKREKNQSTAAMSLLSICFHTTPMTEAEVR